MTATGAPPAVAGVVDGAVTEEHRIGGRRVPARLETLDTGKPLSPARSEIAGDVMVDECVGGGTAVPFGGTELSGTGRERGMIALESYVALQTVVARVGARSTCPAPVTGPDAPERTDPPCA